MFFFVCFFLSLKMSDFFHARSASKRRYRSRMPHHSLKYCHLIVCLPLLLTIPLFNCFGSILYKQTMKTNESSKDFGRLLSKRRSWGKKINYSRDRQLKILINEWREILIQTEL